MKISRISFVMCLLLLCTLQSKSAVIVHYLPQSEFDIEQSPLSDDETNPISANTTDIAEFDFEDNDKNNAGSTHFKVVSFFKSKLELKSITLLNTTNFYSEQLHFSLLHSHRSYLQVFLI